MLSSAAGVRAAFVRQIFDVALEGFRSAPMLIIDVRNNPGGNDALAFEIAGRFMRTRVVFGSVRFRNGPSHTDFAPPRNAW
jgi:C-terminal processing protease CtpA/Prc